MRELEGIRLANAMREGGAAIYHQLWSDLHRYALAWEGDRIEALAWLSAFDARVPSAGCSCRQHWAQLRRDIPPDLTSAETFWKWSYSMHAAVSRRIGKPVPTLEEARAIWEKQ